MPSVFGKESKKKELIANLGETYLKIEKEHQISPGDFPKIARMQVRDRLWESTSGLDFSFLREMLRKSVFLHI